MKKILTGVFFALFGIVVVGIFVLSAIGDAEDGPNTITATSGAVSAYKNGDPILTHKTDMKLSTDGNIKCYKMIYIPSAKEFQITVKYNKIVYEKLGANEDEGFDFVLYNTKTGEENTSYIVSDRSAKGRFCYYRLVFHEVVIQDDADIELAMHPAGKRDVGSAIKLHRSTQQFEDYKLSKKEIAALGGK